MENGQRNNQNIKVVIPPRPNRKSASQPPASQPPASQQSAQIPAETVQGTAQPVRVSIPPRPNRKTSQQQVQIPDSATVSSAPVRVQMPSRSIPNRKDAGKGTRAEMSFEQLAQLASSVVMIMVHDKSGKPFASGSGIMIGRKGYILTNNHVLSDGSFFSVRIENDDNSYRTEQVIKYNQLLDLAVIRIDRELNPLPIYKGPQKLVRGQKVVAIGSPLGLFNSVSDGIIAGFRVLDDVDMIQYTAPTSPGSSGGAVLNMYGEVIGISTAIAPGAQGINWAVGYEFMNLFTQGFVN